MSIIGQTKIYNYITNTNINKISRTILFMGNKGCGKHTFATLLSNKLNIPLEDVTDTISFDLIKQINIIPISKLYFIDLTLLPIKKQNCLLKLIEEPPLTSYIVMVAENANQVLNTVLNRSMIFTFDSYSKEELSTLVVDKLHEKEILAIASTPGQVISFNYESYIQCTDLCKKVIQYYNNIEFSNFLRIIYKLNIDDKSTDKIDVMFFLKTMLITTLELWKTNNIKDFYNIYTLTNKYLNILYDSRMNKDYIICNYLTELWKIGYEIK
jgi:DNA polymerase III delta prime subunit